MAHRIVVAIDIDASSPGEAYRKLLAWMKETPDHISWESTDEWYDESGDPIDPKDIQRICLWALDKTPLTRDIADKIYDILVNVLSAPESYRNYFVQSQSSEFISEWRFQGLLGYGGKFWRNAERWYVNCYPEDLTPTKDRLIERADRQLHTLYNEYKKKYRGH